MAHTPIEELRAHIQEAKQKVSIGARYAHYKHPHDAYRILDIAVLEADESIVVLYTNETSGVTFVRPLQSFIEEVSADGVETPRFIRL